MRPVPPGAWADDLERLRSLLAREAELLRAAVTLLTELHYRRGCPWTHIAKTVAPTLGFAHATERRVRLVADQLRKRVERSGTHRPIKACERSASGTAIGRAKGEIDMGRIIKKQVETTWEEVGDDEDLGDHEERDRDDDDEPEGGPDERRRPRRR